MNTQQRRTDSFRFQLPPMSQSNFNNLTLNSQSLNLDGFNNQQRYLNSSMPLNLNMLVPHARSMPQSHLSDSRLPQRVHRLSHNSSKGIQKRTAQSAQNNHQKQQLRALKDRIGKKPANQDQPFIYESTNRFLEQSNRFDVGYETKNNQQRQGGSRLHPVDLSDSDEIANTTHNFSGKSSVLSLVVDKSSFTEKLNHQISKFFFRNVQTLDVLKQKRSLCNRLFEVARAAAETQYSCNMFLVGSTLNGCASKTSDADLCLYLPNTSVDKRKTLNLLERLRNRLRKTGEFHGIQLIRATVPILKFHDYVTGFECDLNINNSVGIRNTHLLKAYSLVDERLAQLMFAIKYWARYNGINDASCGTFNSYSLALMTIFFLQVGVSPPIAPVLQQVEQNVFSTEREVEQLPRLDFIAAKYSSPAQANKLSVAQLFCNFFSFYNKKFNFEYDIASIRLGRKIKRSTKSEPQWTEKYICIEEPFDQSNTARAVYSVDKFEQIKSAFQDAEGKIQNERRFDCFISTHG